MHSYNNLCPAAYPVTNNLLLSEWCNCKHGSIVKESMLNFHPPVFRCMPTVKMCFSDTFTVTYDYLDALHTGSRFGMVPMQLRILAHSGWNASPTSTVLSLRRLVQHGLKCCVSDTTVGDRILWYRWSFLSSSCLSSLNHNASISSISDRMVNY
jgi:hypothetical protein